MKSNLKRRKEIFEGVLPPEGTKEYLNTINSLKKNNENNPKMKEFIEKCQKKISLSLEAQCLSHCNLITEKTLRQYLIEFNNRAWNYGLRSMPTMFNILESFFIYRKPEIYFELIEEENYTISYFDFIDFITSKNFTDNKKLIEENLMSDIIYNFNVGQDLEEIKFKTDDENEFIIAGISIIRRNNEVTVLVNTGRKRTEKESFTLVEGSHSKLPDKQNLIDDFNKKSKEVKNDFVYIDEEKQYVKGLFVCRIDLETFTIDARYVAEETALAFSVSTDELDGYLNDQGEFESEELKEIYEKGLGRLDDFCAVFEATKMSLYLPYYFNMNESSIKEETLETPFKAQMNNPITKRKFNDIFGYKCSLKPIYSLKPKNELSPDIIKFRDDLFKIERDGYWEKLGVDDIGQDKGGNPINGKTWVTKTLSWFEAKKDDLIITKDKPRYTGVNAGYIYILRNPSMEENIFKIGLTRNDVDERAKQLSKTSVPDKFYKAQEWSVKNCVLAEKEIHKKLEKQRIDPRREFFNIQYSKAVDVINEVIIEINSID